MNKDEETIRAAFEKWSNYDRWETYSFPHDDVSLEAFKHILSLIPGGLPAAAALLRGEAVVVPKEPTAPMIYAGVAAYEDETGGERLPDADGQDHDISRTMLRTAIAATPFKP